MTAGELETIRRIQRLDGDAARLYARLTGRLEPVSSLQSLEHLVSDVRGTLDVLVVADLADVGVPWGRPEARKMPAVRVRHTSLVRRLERWALMSRHRDRSTLVVERLGHQRWPEYAPTSGPTVHGDRRTLLAWEELFSRLDSLTVEEMVGALRTAVPAAPAALSLRGSLIRRTVAAATALERAHTPHDALRVYAQLSSIVRPASIAVRQALAAEAAGRPAEALTSLRKALPSARPPERIAILRTGRRLARASGASWPPDPPLRRPHERDLAMTLAASRSRRRSAEPTEPGSRPLWGAPPLPVEAAVVRLLAKSGRRAFHAEGGLWTTLYALLLADEAYFLPVPGMLPCHWLSGPLDAGTPAFATRRAEAVERVRSKIRDCEADSMLSHGAARWRGVTLAGVVPELLDEDLPAVARGLGPGGLLAGLDTLLSEGFSSARGAPDLVVLPGPEVLVPGLFPSKIPGKLLLAELKTPTDPLRDAQRIWCHRLLESGVPCEVWQVRPARTAGVL